MTVKSSSSPTAAKIAAALAGAVGLVVEGGLDPLEDGGQPGLRVGTALERLQSIGDRLAEEHVAAVPVRGEVEVEADDRRRAGFDRRQSVEHAGQR